MVNQIPNVLDQNSYGRLLPIIEKNNLPIVIVGNGPSVSRINYKRLPKEFLTFRINNFFLEDKYYLGKNVDLCYASMPIDNSIYTLLGTITNHEYKFNSNFFFTRERVTGRFPDQSLFPRIEIEKLLSLDIKMSSYMAEIFHYQQKHITSGILSLLASIVMGFKKIYLIGLDFYSDTDRRYAYKLGENYKKSLTKEDLVVGYSETLHSRDIDLKGLDIALSYPDVQIQSICDDAFVNQFVDLAEANNKSPMKVSKKTGDWTNDLLIAPNLQTEPRNLITKLSLQKEIKYIKKSLFIKLIWGLIVQPLVIIPFMLAKKLIQNLVNFLRKKD